MRQMASIYARTPETKNEKSASRIRKTGLSQSVKSPAKRILFLQRTIGNQAVQRLIKSGALQTKLTVNPPGDIYEQEADRVARQVMSRINQVSHTIRQNKPVQRQGLCREEKCGQTKSSDIQLQAIPKEEEEKKLMTKLETDTVQRQEMPKEEEEEKLMKKDMVQRNEANGGWTAAPELESSIRQVRGGGQPLSDNVRAPMEQAFGADFSGVRVHTDTHSDMLNHSLQARAFTTGKDIFFKQGEYNPGSSAGQELLAHELTHVVQQNGDVGSNHKQAMQMRGEKLQRQHEEEEELLQTKKITWHNAEIPLMLNAPVNHINESVIQPAYIGTRPLNVTGGKLLKFISFGLAYHKHIFFEDGGDPANIGFGPHGLFTETDDKLIKQYKSEGVNYDDAKMRTAYQAVPPGEYSVSKNNCKDWVNRVVEKYNTL